MGGGGGDSGGDRHAVYLQIIKIYKLCHLAAGSLILFFVVSHFMVLFTDIQRNKNEIKTKHIHTQARLVKEEGSKKGNKIKIVCVL